MRMIAASAAMEAASLYNHIRSKQDILEELLFSLADAFIQGMERAEGLQAGPFEKLEFLVDLHIDLTLRWPDRMALVTGEWIHLDEPKLSAYLKLRNDYEMRFRKLIQEGMEKGIFENLSSDLSLYSILSSLHLLNSWTARHPEMDTNRLRKELKQCLLKGLLKN